MLNIVLADDHQVFREGLAKLFAADEDIHIVDMVGDGDALAKAIQDNEIDIAVMDVSMPGPGVLGICRQIEEFKLKTRVMVLTMHEEISLAKELLEHGASAFVLKRSAFHEIKEAISAIRQGERYASPSVATRLVGSPSAKPLSSRELEVVLLIADGLTNAEVADQLRISISTVQTHRARAMEKLNVRSGIELVRRLVENGLLR